MVVFERSFRVFEDLFHLSPDLFEQVFFGNLLVEASTLHVRLVDGIASATVAERVLAGLVSDVAPTAGIAFYEPSERMGHLVTLHRLVFLDKLLRF